MFFFCKTYKIIRNPSALSIAKAKDTFSVKEFKDRLLFTEKGTTKPGNEAQR